jgi:uncharacterized membrane protein HdeD (DUF308 family)
MNTVVGKWLWKYKLGGGILAAVLGAVMLVWPGPSILVAATLLGVYLLASGIAELFAAFALPVSSATSRVLLFISGALSVVLAILSFRHFGDAYAVLLLALWIGIGFVFQGVTATVIGIGAPQLPGRGWTIAAGIVSAIAGLVVVTWPFDSIAVLTVVVGIWLVVIGVSQVVDAILMRRDAKTVHRNVEAVTQPAAA